MLILGKDEMTQTDFVPSCWLLYVSFIILICINLEIAAQSLRRCYGPRLCRSAKSAKITPPPPPRYFSA